MEDLSEQGVDINEGSEYLLSHLRVTKKGGSEFKLQYNWELINCIDTRIKA